MRFELSRTGTQEKIKEFFLEIKNKSPKEIRKIKKLAMNKKISLKEHRKKFCKHCFTPFSGREKVRIKNKVKSVTCNVCGEVSRWELK